MIIEGLENTRLIYKLYVSQFSINEQQTSEMWNSTISFILEPPEQNRCESNKIWARSIWGKLKREKKIHDKKIKELNKWDIIYVFRLEDINIIKMSVFPNLIYRLN